VGPIIYHLLDGLVNLKRNNTDGCHYLGMKAAVTPGVPGTPPGFFRGITSTSPNFTVVRERFAGLGVVLGLWCPRTTIASISELTLYSGEGESLLEPSSPVAFTPRPEAQLQRKPT
jgi:hypothetical protein